MENELLNMQRKYIKRVNNYFYDRHILIILFFCLADIQKQERIDQMMIDINKYKKIDKDLSALQEKHNELEKSLNLKLNNITQQRDDLQKTCDKLKEKVQEYEQMKQKYDQLNENQTKTTNINELQQELNEAKAKNDLLRQRNWKIMEQLNKLTHK